MRLLAIPISKNDADVGDTTDENVEPMGASIEDDIKRFKDENQSSRVLIYVSLTSIGRHRLGGTLVHDLGFVVAPVLFKLLIRHLRIICACLFL